MSGKTTLAYKLLRIYSDQGLIPVYINASQINTSNDKKIISLVHRRIKRQFINITEKVLSEINVSKVVIIIDDYQNIKTNKKTTALLNENLNENYKFVVIFSNSSKQLELLTDNLLHDSLTSFEKFRLTEYGYKLRDEIISKWLSIGQIETIDEEYKYKKVLEISEVINTTVGNSFVPTFPIFVLTILQSFEAATTHSLKGSAYAEFYNYLITQALGKSGIQPSDIGLFYSYLSELSFIFFNEAKNEFNNEELSNFHDTFIKKRRIERSFEKFSKVLIESKVLKFENELYRFNHNYIYYFFVARYLSEKTSNPEIRSIIESITKRVHLTEFANILLFLVHFSKDQFIFDGIISESKKVFNELDEVTFDKSEFSKINDLISGEIKITINDQTPEESRRQRLEQKDNNSNDRNVSRELSNSHSHRDDISELDVFSKINLSFKLIEMLGQLAKNYTELDGDVKVEIISEAYKLGLRSLKELLGSFEDFSELIEEEIRTIINEKGAKSNSEINDITSKIVFNLASMISYGFLSKISNSVASKDLDSVISEVYLTDQTVAKELINTAISLDFSHGLDSNTVIKLNDKLKGNNLAQTLLKLFVRKHLYKFNINYSKRQKVCAKLNIDINNKQQVLSNQNKHLK